MIELVALHRELLPEAPQADAIALNRSLLRAARDFCEKTLVLEATADPRISIVAGEPLYTLPAVPDHTIVKIKRESVWWGNDRQVAHRSEDQLDRDVGSPDTFLIAEEHNALASLGNLSQPWRAMRAPVPSFYYQPRPWQIRLVPIPTADAPEKLGVTYHLKPSLSATALDDFVVENWYEAIVEGALADLLAIQQKPWTNEREAARHRDKFLDAIDKVVAERVSGYGSNDYAVGKVKAWI